MEGLLGDGANLDNPDEHSLTDSGAYGELRLERALRRRLERMREPQVFHPIDPRVKTGYPDGEKEEELTSADSGRRAEQSRKFHKELRRRMATHISTDEFPPDAARRGPPPAMRRPGSNKPPTYFPGRPSVPGEKVADRQTEQRTPKKPMRQGDSLASRARRLKKKRQSGNDK